MKFFLAGQSPGKHLQQDSTRKGHKSTEGIMSVKWTIAYVTVFAVLVAMIIAVWCVANLHAPILIF